MPDKPKFNQGDKVFSRYNLGQQGDITGNTRTRANSIYYQVRFSDRFDYLPDYELEFVTEKPMDPDELIEKKRFGQASDLRRNLTHVQLSGKLSDTLYSMDITKTDFYPHQFKPVLAFLESPSRGLLIADEVGLGKTIEAGLIWTELRARFDCRRVLVVCPAMLREKWHDELRDRFGVDTTIMDAGELLAELKRPLDQIPDGKGIICSIQGIRPPRDQQDGNPSTARYELKEFFENQAANDPIIDLVIIDEAHYMRNRSSQNARLGAQLRDISGHMLLLSATPINLRSDDLFSLLNIVDQDTFSDPKIFPEDGAREKIITDQVYSILEQVHNEHDHCDNITQDNIANREATEGVPLMLCGGGASVNFYQQVVETLTQRGHGYLLYKKHLSMGDDQYDAPDILKEDNHRLSVAYGLSFNALNIGKISHPPPIPANNNQRQPCPLCRGTGGYGNCRRCGGSGRL